MFVHYCIEKHGDIAPHLHQKYYYSSERLTCHARNSKQLSLFLLGKFYLNFLYLTSDTCCLNMFLQDGFNFCCH
ncbi:hypothetical protein EG888_01050 [Listeria monocytogenes]|uniref:Uncharacterized protein n=2 Tax=Listeria monocytogenes TaxID=1639 RepID=A0A9P2DLN3_LISMN|nr:putative uncharacterized protein [Listeria monocytogenes 08-5578]ADB71434.1 putative uncharacterized protein [Listeria monocytogenes 08-5923]APQ08361.1 hypothetical protein BTR18_07370 [Listeria monocytogenes]EAA0165695.1 hypothetical protein [Listeria monocytogenes serotype 1/2a]EAE3701138.1 hypothetical protein [Listeria monocytogenes serotype 1/2c]EAE6022528.1 hypothetical protein [Listeria monocytogenes serotype 3a]EAF4500208.1 hypothetical protein [Listeria monocytogenes serotype 4b]